MKQAGRLCGRLSVGQRLGGEKILVGPGCVRKTVWLEPRPGSASQEAPGAWF